MVALRAFEGVRRACESFEGSLEGLEGLRGLWMKPRGSWNEFGGSRKGLSRELGVSNVVGGVQRQLLRVEN